MAADPERGSGWDQGCTDRSGAQIPAARAGIAVDVASLKVDGRYKVDTEDVGN